MIRIEKRKGWNDIKHRKAAYILNDQVDAKIVWDLISEKTGNFSFWAQEVADINLNIETYPGTIEEWFNCEFSTI